MSPTSRRTPHADQTVGMAYESALMIGLSRMVAVEECWA
jgi:hypothetical protein